eukprot:m.254483 g.254483  ORF g.254483 m.254483 type:complete len:522 (-) comp22681_c2_seq13:26-1591(-)
MLLLLFVSTASALSVPHLFGDNMVLQRDTAVPIWGYDDAGSNVTVTFNSVKHTAQTDASGRWQVALPSTPASTAAYALTIANTKGQTLTINGVLFGDVFLCSGQSNMELSVISTLNASEEIADATQWGQKGLRYVQVAPQQTDYNVTEPQLDFTPSIPWSVASSANVAGLSAMCYYFGRQVLSNRPGVPVGLIATSWGGTAIEVWMSPEALQACGEGSEPVASMRNPDPGLAYLGGSGGKLRDGPPSKHSVLYYSMIFPFLWTPLRAWLWYQGESNCGNPVGYSRCFPQMITQWRGDWAARAATPANTPFIFVQISSWPAGNTGAVSVQRYAQMAALKLDNVGMIVAADIGDPASALHPVHPPFKQEVARRGYQIAQSIIFNDAAAPPKQGPMVKALVVDKFSQDWGDYHYGTGPGICALGEFTCFGVRITFDQPLTLNPSFGSVHGMATAFELVSAHGTQPVLLTGLRDPYTVQLNVTDIMGQAQTLLYGWHDYPNMPLYSSKWNRPAPPFNVSLAGLLH